MKTSERSSYRPPAIDITQTKAMANFKVSISYVLGKACKENDQNTPIKELNVPSYRLRYSVALYI